VSSSLSESSVEVGDVAKGSLEWLDRAMLLEKSAEKAPTFALDEGRRLRVGRSEALRIVGFAFNGSADMVASKLEGRGRVGG
jgi:hypothetical protein